LRLGTAFEQAALDQQPVYPHAFCHGISITAATPMVKAFLTKREP
jgi:hypothetical protein